jgi:hypothetical protein
MLAGGLAFGLSMAAPKATNVVVRWLLPLLILAAPLMPFALDLLPGLPSEGALRAVGVWRGAIEAEPLRLLTGHGLGTVLRTQLAGLLSSHAPHSALFEVWYELGLVGAAATAGLVAFAVRGAARYGPALASGLVGAVVNLFVFACFGLVVSQPWWLSLVGAMSIAFCAVIHGRFGTRRPKASLSS